MVAADLVAIASIEQSVHTAPWSSALLKESLHQHLCWKLTKAEEIIAYLIAMPAGDEVEILNIAVARNWQRSGLARFLLNHLIEYAQKAQSGRIFLEVRQSNHAARNLYKSLGFTQAGLRKNYYAADIGKEDALIMRLDV